MGDILFLAHRIPFPPDRGDKIRSHHLLLKLAELAPVHVGCFADNDVDLGHAGALRDIAASQQVLRRRTGLAMPGLRALASGKPVSLTAFDDPAMREWVSRTLAEKNIDCIFVFSGQMGQYVPADFGGRIVIDLCDVDSAKFASYAEGANAATAWIYDRESRLLAREEARLASRADHTLLVSEAEAELFRSLLATGSRHSVSVLRNGVDTSIFDPRNCQPHAALEQTPGPHIVFTGQMDYPPNVQACERVTDSILPMIREKQPGATIHIVGRAPVERLIRRDGKQGVRVWGEVPDVRPFLAASDAVIAPLTIARGVQNKVLEAMAMARSVVLSAEAAAGIDATDGTHWCVGRSDAELADHVCALVEDPVFAANLGRAARDYVIEHQDWDAMLKPLAALVAGPALSGCRDAA